MPDQTLMLFCNRLTFSPSICCLLVHLSVDSLEFIFSQGLQRQISYTTYHFPKTDIQLCVAIFCILSISFSGYLKNENGRRMNEFDMGKWCFRHLLINLLKGNLFFVVQLGL